MSSITFADQVTIIPAPWAQDVNDAVYKHWVALRRYAGADPTGVTDSTAALLQAISDAKALKTNAVDCSGGAWRIDTGGIDLTGITLYSNVAPDFGNTTPDFGDSGCAFLLTSTTNVPFTLGLGWKLSGITFYWPNQTGATMPVTYPPLFTGTYIAGGVMEDVTVVNAWTFLKANSGVAFGDCRFSRCRIYAIDTVFWFLQGVPEIVNITDCLFTYGVFPPSYTPNTYLRDHTAASGTFMLIDVGGSGHPSVDGMQVTQSLVFGYRYGIRVLSGQLNVSNILGSSFDQVATALSVEGDATCTNTRIESNYFWSDTPGVTTNDYPTIAFVGTSSLSDVTLIGNDFAFSRSDHVRIVGVTEVDDLHIEGNRFRNWGLSTASPLSSFFAVTITDATASGYIAGNSFRPVPGVVAHNRIGVAINGNLDTSLSGNNFESCYLPVWIISASKVALQGNYSNGTAYGFSVRNDAATGVLTSSGNVFDKGIEGPSGQTSLTATGVSQTFTGAKTQALFATSVFDLDVNLASSTFTVPALGVYEVTCALSNNSGETVNDVWGLTLEQAGSTTTVFGTTGIVLANVAGATPLRLTGLFKCVAGDTIKAYVTRLSGSGSYVTSLTAIYNTLSVRRVS